MEVTIVVRDVVLKLDDVAVKDGEGVVVCVSEVVDTTEDVVDVDRTDVVEVTVAVVDDVDGVTDVIENVELDVGVDVATAKEVLLLLLVVMIDVDDVEDIVEVSLVDAASLVVVGVIDDPPLDPDPAALKTTPALSVTDTYPSPVEVAYISSAQSIGCLFIRTYGGGLAGAGFARRSLTRAQLALKSH
ncbi:uncharacterized protein BT62DRAFT_1079502 [Guyanagaster necrorhizus]|uniref:Uncharacterized protein n=1 Tax=Guyanagaster necrorhizus TaxID=856835 RepID=A0A9P7VKD5_9AGAR|nr:uncharacterized protein BT62DRAFT_1079502 [Guyanagaster necrorhizus MCA 3950]KAG7442178.1 hypothetical protein BT62DRAFT_1079502 [Guyanagaster necrorhizus MCA 3950]